MEMQTSPFTSPILIELLQSEVPCFSGVCLKWERKSNNKKLHFKPSFSASVSAFQSLSAFAHLLLAWAITTQLQPCILPVWLVFHIFTCILSLQIALLFVADY